MNINFTPDALADLDSIYDFIGADDQESARRVMARLLQSIAVLESFPLAGRLGRVNGTREWSIARLPYFTVYRIAGATDLDILAVIHTSRQWPPTPDHDE